MLKKFLSVGLRVITVLVIFAGGMVAQGLYNKYKTDGAQKVAHKFVNMIATGYADKAYPMTSKDFQSKMPEASFDAQMGALKSDTPSFLPDQTFVKGNSAYYFQKVDNMPKTAAGRTDGNFSVSLVKEGGGWKVAAVSVN